MFYAYIVILTCLTAAIPLEMLMISKSSYEDRNIHMFIVVCIGVGFFALSLLDWGPLS